MQLADCVCDGLASQAWLCQRPKHKVEKEWIPKEISDESEAPSLQVRPTIYGKLAAIEATHSDAAGSSSAFSHKSLLGVLKQNLFALTTEAREAHTRHETPGKQTEQYADMRQTPQHTARQNLCQSRTNSRTAAGAYRWRMLEHIAQRRRLQ